MCVLGVALCEPVDAGICGCSWRFLVPGEAGLPPPLPEAGGAKPAPWKRDGHYWASVRCQALKRALDREVPVWRRTLRLREVHVRPRSSRPVQLLGCHWFPSCPPRLWQKGESASVCISARQMSCQALPASWCRASKRTPASSTRASCRRSLRSRWQPRSPEATFQHLPL